MERDIFRSQNRLLLFIAFGSNSIVMQVKCKKQGNILHKSTMQMNAYILCWSSSWV